MKFVINGGAAYVRLEVVRIEGSTYPEASSCSVRSLSCKKLTQAGLTSEHHKIWNSGRRTYMPSHTRAEPVRAAFQVTKGDDRYVVAFPGQSFQVRVNASSALFASLDSNECIYVSLKLDGACPGVSKLLKGSNSSGVFKGFVTKAASGLRYSYFRSALEWTVAWPHLLLHTGNSSQIGADTLRGDKSMLYCGFRNTKSAQVVTAELSLSL